MALPPAARSSADLIVVHAMSWLVLTYSDHPNRDMVCACLGAALGKANVAVPLMADLVRYAPDVINGPGADVRREVLCVLERMHMSRLASAQDAFMAEGQRGAA